MDNDTTSASELSPVEMIDQRIAVHKKALASARQAATNFARQAVVIQGALQELSYLKRQLAPADEPPPPSD